MSTRLRRWTCSQCAPAQLPCRLTAEVDGRRWELEWVKRDSLTPALAAAAAAQLIRHWIVNMLTADQVIVYALWEERPFSRDTRDASSSSSTAWPSASTSRHYHTTHDWSLHLHTARAQRDSSQCVTFASTTTTPEVLHNRQVRMFARCMTSLPEVRSWFRWHRASSWSIHLHYTTPVAAAVAVHLCFQLCEFWSEIPDYVENEQYVKLQIIKKCQKYQQFVNS